MVGDHSANRESVEHTPSPPRRSDRSEADIDIAQVVLAAPCT
jgi:hypothetical protein